MGAKDSYLGNVWPRISVSLRIKVVRPAPNLGTTRVTIVSILRLTSLVKFANSQNISCEPLLCCRYTKTDHGGRGLRSCGVLEHY
jgi:hypothetical protein